MSEKSQLVDNLTRDKQIREAYIRSKVSTSVASQIRALRRRERLTQAGLAQLAEMKQSRISAMEYPGGNQVNVETLVRLAAALKVGLTVRFGSFSEMLNWENNFSQDEFTVTNLDDDLTFHRDEDSITPITVRPQGFDQSTVADENKNTEHTPFYGLETDNPAIHEIDAVREDLVYGG